MRCFPLALCIFTKRFLSQGLFDQLTTLEFDMMLYYTKGHFLQFFNGYFKMAAKNFHFYSSFLKSQYYNVLLIVHFWSALMLHSVVGLMKKSIPYLKRLDFKWLRFRGWKLKNASKITQLVCFYIFQYQNSAIYSPSTTLANFRADKKVWPWGQCIEIFKWMFKTCRFITAI